MTATILPLRIDVTVNFEDGSAPETIAIKPFSFGKLPAVTKHLANIAAGLSLDEVSIPALVAVGGEDILSILSVATGKPRAWFDTIDSDSGVALVSAVVNANKESFAKKLMPALAGLATTLTAKKAA